MRAVPPRTVAAVATLTLVGGLLTACSAEGPDDTLTDFLTGWRSGDLKAVGFVTAAGGGVSATDVSAQITALSGDLAKQAPAVTAVGTPTTTGDDATSPVKVDWTLPGGTHWIYDSTVRLSKRDSDGWRVVWEPAIVQPQLETGDKLALRRTASVRAAIQGPDGKPLVDKREVVTIGVTPQAVTDLPKLQNGLAAAFTRVGADVDLSKLKDRLDDADPGAFVELITLRRDDYNKIRDAVRPLPGTVFRAEERDLAPTRVFARALLGTADVATREDIDASPQTVAQGDVVGHGGLQQKYDAVLRGTPGSQVVIAKTAADDKVTDTKLFSTDPIDGKPVKISLDVDTQNAADQALAPVKEGSSLVAIKVSDGSVLAVANGPGGGTVNTALTGQVPPGSTFKTVSAYGLLQSKAVTMDTTVACPKTLAAGGREFRNADGEVLGAVPFRVDYAKSCNTAFVSLSGKLGAPGLQQASAALGLGGAWDLGIDAFSGTVSTADTPAELAAAAFGQGRTAVSPLSMASVAASVARGRFKQPTLVLDPAPAKPAPDGANLDTQAIAELRTMMREVVTKGTGTALRAVPGGPVHGKTGTAEFDENSKDTHSWFIGYQGDVAFAAMVEKGGLGSEAAVPVVSRFLTTLNR